MNMEQSMCAASGPASQWEQIDWSQCEQKVRKLQARIVKATQEGRHGKVKALQWLLTHSFCVRALAVRRVTHNKGKNTQGVDGAIWRSPASRHKAVGTLRRRGYFPQPLRRTSKGVWISVRSRVLWAAISAASGPLKPLRERASSICWREDWRLQGIGRYSPSRRGHALACLDLVAKIAEPERQL